MHAYPAGQRIPKVLYAVDMIFLVCKKYGVVNLEMLKV
jgi:hypothetical protein